MIFEKELPFEDTWDSSYIRPIFLACLYTGLIIYPLLSLLLLIEYFLLSWWPNLWLGGLYFSFVPFWIYATILVRKNEFHLPASIMRWGALFVYAITLLLAPLPLLPIIPMGLGIFIILTAAVESKRTTLFFTLLGAVIYSAALSFNQFGPLPKIKVPHIEFTLIIIIPLIILILTGLIGVNLVRYLRLSLLENQRSHDELAQKNQDLTHFTHSLSHDLKEPISATKAYVQILQQKLNQERNFSYQKDIQSILDSIERFQSLMDGYLDYCQTGNQRIQLQGLSLQELIDTLRSDFKLLLQDHNAKVYGSHLPKVQGDFNLLYILFQNLLMNSLHFKSTDPPKIVISSFFSKGKWIISFEDNGVGIHSADKERIFNIFERTDSSSTSPSSGTGIGLATCKKITELHGGQIWAEPNPDQGTKFFFSLAPAETYTP